MEKKQNNIVVFFTIAIIVGSVLFVALFYTDYADTLGSNQEVSALASLTVSQPSGGTYDASKQLLVRIKTSVSNTNIDIYLMRGSYWETKLGSISIGSASYTETGKYFTIPSSSSLTTGSDYRIRAYTKGYNSVSSYFSLNVPAGYSVTKKITVISPNGGEILTKGGTCTITVDLVTGGTSKIGLYLSKGSTYNYYHIINLLDRTSGTHTYNFDIPLTLAAGTDYKICAILGTIKDFSNNYFTIKDDPNTNIPSELPEIRFITPTSYTTWGVGDTELISWYATGDIRSIYIQVCKTDYVIKQIAVGAPSTGTLTFTVPLSYAQEDDYSIRARGNIYLNGQLYKQDVFWISDDFSIGPPSRPGDINHDGETNLNDLGIMANDFGKTGNPGWRASDINKDGIVDIADFAIISYHWNN